MEGTKSMLPLDDGWEHRCQNKIVATALASFVASAQSALKQDRSVLQAVPKPVLGYTGSMALFCAVLEGLRAARGRHDAWNSLAAGALVGGAVAGHFQGPQYRLLGAVLWGPICGVLHVTNEWLRPRYLIEDALISEGLLDPSVLDRRPLAAEPRPDELYRSAHGMPMEDLMQDAMQIRIREVQQLKSAIAPQQQRQAASGQSSGSSGSRQGRDAPPPQLEQEDQEDEGDFAAWMAAARASGAVPFIDTTEESPAETGRSSRGGSGTDSGSSSSSSSSGAGASGPQGVSQGKATRTWGTWLRGLVPWRRRATTSPASSSADKPPDLQ